MVDFVLSGEPLRQQAVKLINALDLSKPWIISVQRQKKKRSLSQNALLHKWFEIIADETGDDSESVKHDFKMMFLEKVERVSHITGEVTMEPKHTSDLATPEMSAFMDRVYAFATSQLGILLPTPEEGHVR